MFKSLLDLKKNLHNNFFQGFKKSMRNLNEIQIIKIQSIFA